MAGDEIWGAPDPVQGSGAGAPVPGGVTPPQQPGGLAAWVAQQGGFGPRRTTPDGDVPSASGNAAGPSAGPAAGLSAGPAGTDPRRVVDVRGDQAPTAELTVVSDPTPTAGAAAGAVAGAGAGYAVGGTLAGLAVAPGVRDGIAVPDGLDRLGYGGLGPRLTPEQNLAEGGPALLPTTGAPGGPGWDWAAGQHSGETGPPPGEGPQRGKLALMAAGFVTLLVVSGFLAFNGLPGTPAAAPSPSASSSPSGSASTSPSAGPVPSASAPSPSASSPSPSASSTAFTVAYSPQTLAFGTAVNVAMLQFRITGQTVQPWTAKATGRGLSVAPATGQAAPGGTVPLVVRLHRAGLAQGRYTGQITLTVGSKTQIVPVTATIGTGGTGLQITGFSLNPNPVYAATTVVGPVGPCSQTTANVQVTVAGGTPVGGTVTWSPNGGRTVTAPLVIQGNRLIGTVGPFRKVVPSGASITVIVQGAGGGTATASKVLGVVKCPLVF